MKLYSNEIVFRGHPDKVCDQIAGALINAYLSGDQYSRCGIEVTGGKGKIFITGEVTSSALIDVKGIVRRVLEDVGYPTDYEIINNLGMQSSDIAMGTSEEDMGAGDQGMMFGYATDETPQMLPKAMVILQEFAKCYDILRTEDHRYLPDGKAQITGYYDDHRRLLKIKTAVISYQNTEENRKETDGFIKALFEKIAHNHGVEVEEYYINPTGRFEIGGFEGDAGVCGRKIVVDSYQSFAPVGGGNMNGKDPSKVDISGAYIAREFAKECLKKYGLSFCRVQLSYAIGIKRPMAIYINSDKGYIEADEEMYKRAEPLNIINDLNMRSLDYEKAAMYGHFTK